MNRVSTLNTTAHSHALLLAEIEGAIAIDALHDESRPSGTVLQYHLVAHNERVLRETQQVREGGGIEAVGCRHLRAVVDVHD